MIRQSRQSALLATTLALSLAATHAAAQGENARRGGVLARWRCAGCHAVTADGESPARAAPPFAALARGYTISGLERRLTQGHRPNAMPPPDLSPEEALDVAAYIKTFDRTAQGSRN